MQSVHQRKRMQRKYFLETLQLIYMKFGEVQITQNIDQRKKWESIAYPFHTQNLISSSPYCLKYNSYDGSLENLELDQLITSLFY